MADKNLEEKACTHELGDFFDLYEVNKEEAFSKYDGKQEEFYQSFKTCKGCQEIMYDTAPLLSNYELLEWLFDVKEINEEIEREYGSEAEWEARKKQGIPVPDYDKSLMVEEPSNAFPKDTKRGSKSLYDPEE